jgi:hypothetical protein
MFDWLRPRRDASPSVFRRDGPTDTGAVKPRAMSGPYLLLYTYLDARFADTVVLTFAQIEDLLGFALPPQARVQTAWWTDAADSSITAHYSQSWTGAHRTAVPNLSAKIVSFARAF